jgi:hypothetical protein
MMGMQQTSNTISTSLGTEAPRIASREPMPVTPTITPDTSNGWALVLLGAFLFAGCLAAAAGVWYFFLR